MMTKTYILKITILLSVLFFISFLLNTPKIILLSFDTEINVNDENATLELLKILDKNDAKVTFFVMGSFAKNNPEIIIKIMNQGSEVACHTENHRLLIKLSSEEIDDELRECKKNILEITKQESIGFRAPWRKLNKDVFESLIKNNFLYDASYFNLQPTIQNKMIKEIKTSLFGIIPADDYIALNFFHIPKQLYFLLQKHASNDIASMSYHPHIIMEHKKEFNDLLEYFNQKNITFLTHKDLIV